ncbi:MAG: hypothetical protein KDA67_02300 [Rhodobacteraceae bacterium]|nr:hypothetical protein [Paracoccaceae bacterium]
MGGLVAVLTGDIVKSSSMAPGALDEVFQVLNDAAETIAGWAGPPRPAEIFARFRGDGWQFLLTRPSLALRAGLYFRARLFAASKSYDSRIACGIGKGQVRRGLEDADGAAFLTSGRLLDGYTRSQRLGIASDLAPDLQHLAAAIFALAEQISSGWTSRQAMVLAEFLLPQPPVQADIAARLNITQQSVSEHLNASGYAAILQAIESFEGLNVWDDYSAE